ncbi:Uncharacterised protein [Mycobacterium tuberculosis]|nr:Uncharacterised protein [Mycobacterium tuberculosis]
MSMKRTPADVLREARKKDSVAKRARVLAVVDEMKTRDEPITFLGVARAAGVSNWLVYAPGVREHIEAARKGQTARKTREQHSGASASSASLTTDLELARAELRRVRDERDRLQAKVQRGLGRQVEQVSTAELAARIKELTTRLDQRDNQIATAMAENTRLTTRLEAALDDIAGLRSALRQMTRQQNTLT